MFECSVDGKCTLQSNTHASEDCGEALFEIGLRGPADLVGGEAKISAGDEVYGLRAHS
jgi:hypothetical protein